MTNKRDRAILVIGILATVIGIHDSVGWLQVIAGMSLAFYTTRGEEQDD